MTRDELRVHARSHTKENSWWLHDARGIPCGRVCDACIEARKATYRPDVFIDSNYPTDEPVEEDKGW